MKDEKTKRLPEKIEDIRIESELEKKFFPGTIEKKKREEAMKDSTRFEELLTEKLRKCLIKK
ncbi:MAG: hypothetical protein LUO93_04700 [Methanomicrobiales archaeon]|nr:hypothetical protein [Methanomicrobiales archaeon]